MADNYPTPSAHPPELNDAVAQRAFRALADPTRRQILLNLSKDDMTIAQVTNSFPITRAAIKKHLLILQEGELISVRTSGRERINSLNTNGLRSVAAWLKYFNQFWDDKLSDLDAAIRDHQKTNPQEQSK